MSQAYLNFFSLDPFAFFLSMLAYIACKFSFRVSDDGKENVVKKVFSIIGLILASVNFCSIAYTYWRTDSPLYGIYSLIICGLLIALFIRILKGCAAEIITKSLLIIALFTIGSIPVLWLYRLSGLILNEYFMDYIDSIMLNDLQYLLYAGVLIALTLRLIKKNNVKIYTFGSKKKTIVFSSLAFVVVLLTLLFVSPLIMGDVSASLGAPTSLIRSSDITFDYYSDAYNAVRMDKLYRSTVLQSDMITSQDMFSYDPDLMTEIQKDSIAAVASWIVLLLAFVFTLKIQRIAFEQERSSFPAILSIWMLIFLVFLSTQLIFLITHFVYVPVSFIISGIFIVIVYVNYKNNKFFSDRPVIEAKESIM